MPFMVIQAITSTKLMLMLRQTRTGMAQAAVWHDGLLAGLFAAMPFMVTLPTTSTRKMKMVKKVLMVRQMLRQTRTGMAQAAVWHAGLLAGRFAAMLTTG